MRIGVVITHLLDLGEDKGIPPKTNWDFLNYARRFANSYKLYPGEYPHELRVIFLRGEMSEESLSVWEGVDYEFYHWHPTTKDGLSGQAFQDLLPNMPYDFIVAMDSKVYFHRPGWLKRMVEARLQNGDGLYGAMASYYGCPLQTHPEPNPHLRGTVMAFDKNTLLEYPHKITCRDDGYRMESGEWNIGNWYESVGKPAMMVTFDGCYSKPDWKKPKNIFHRGDQSNLLAWDRHSDMYLTATPDQQRDSEIRLYGSLQ